MSFQIKYFTYVCVREKVAVKVLNIFGKRPILGPYVLYTKFFQYESGEYDLTVYTFNTGQAK